MLTKQQKQLAYLCSSFFAFCLITGLADTKENRSAFRQAYTEITLAKLLEVA